MGKLRVKGLWRSAGSSPVTYRRTVPDSAADGIVMGQTCSCPLFGCKALQVPLYHVPWQSLPFCVIPPR